MKKKINMAVCKDFNYFCETCLDTFNFFISEYKYKLVSINQVGSQVIIVFRKSNYEISLNYEIGSLPWFIFKEYTNDLCKELKKEVLIDGLISKFSNELEINNFKYHNEMTNLINIGNLDTNIFIKEVGGFWNNNREDMKNEIELYIKLMGKIILSNKDKFMKYLT